jgi:hypothetical protein
MGRLPAEVIAANRPRRYMEGMTRKTFLSLVSVIATAVGLLALAAPAAVLDSKGVVPAAATKVWVREVGVLILALGIMTFLVRGAADSPTLRAFLIGNAIVQIGLFPIEIVAASAGVLTRVSGIVPNSILHLTLAAGFLHFARRVASAAPHRGG